MAVRETPPGQCPQCWQHANDRSIHRRLKPREDCKPCVDHMRNGCPYLVPKQKAGRR
ncbi:pRL2-8 [Streptomyces sp. NBC_00124]|uniref:pRL2-8 n=1 Tax=Streptomyces sp. NBC_00124 TaxID=2975662 RepID=UPI002257391D|nr:pRL2-8 [Streptomyces sp. NBC_00124]MCX5362378.1 pRL2-8 [Streptomyces sp. NBC_00124]